MPFAYESTGKVTRFTNRINPHPRSREVFAFHRPEELVLLAELPFQLRQGLRENYQELIQRDKLNLDIFWLKDKSLAESEDLPDPEVLAQEIVDDLQTALDQFASIAGQLRE